MRDEADPPFRALVPDVAVAPSARGVAAGEDELLKRARALLHAHPHPVAAALP